MNMKKARPFSHKDAARIGITRSQAAKRLNVSIMVIRTMEKNGKLHPVIGRFGNQDNVRMFNPHEVDSLLPQFHRAKPITAHEAEARVVGLLEQNYDLPRIVLELKGAVSIAEIRRIHGEYTKSLDDGLTERQDRAFEQTMMSIIGGKSK